MVQHRYGHHVDRDYIRIRIGSFSSIGIRDLSRSNIDAGMSGQRTSEGGVECRACICEGLGLLDQGAAQRPGYGFRVSGLGLLVEHDDDSEERRVVVQQFLSPPFARLQGGAF